MWDLVLCCFNKTLKNLNSAFLLVPLFQYSSTRIFMLEHSEQCMVMGWMIVLGIFVCMLLLIHHKLHHSDPTQPDTFIQDPCEQWFQYKLYPEGDVCNFARCSHEMWIIALAAVVLICIVLVVVLDCNESK